MTPHTVLLRWLEGPPTPLARLSPGVPDELVAICEKAMARASGDRYGSMLELAGDIEAFLEGRVVSAYEAGSLAEARKWIQRNRGMGVALAVALLLAIGGTLRDHGPGEFWASQLELANTDLAAANAPRRRRPTPSWRRPRRRRPPSTPTRAAGGQRAPPSMINERTAPAQLRLNILA
jgi:hypothetical protein